MNQEINNPMTTAEVIFHLEYSGYSQRRNLGITHEELISVGIGNKEMKKKYEARRANINWVIGSVEDDGGDGHTFFHIANGHDQFGNTYLGTAVMVDDYLDEVRDIEMEDES